MVRLVFFQLVCFLFAGVRLGCFQRDRYLGQLGCLGIEQEETEQVVIE
jgi:hypothetical protein